MSDHMICYTCGQITGIKEYNIALWSMYSRRKDGRQNIEPLVYTQDDLDAGWFDDDDGYNSVIDSMERNMHERGLCTECRRPNLTGLQEEDFHSEEDLQEMQEMWAIEAAERRAGC